MKFQRLLENKYFIRVGTRPLGLRVLIWRALASRGRKSQLGRFDLAGLVWLQTGRLAIMQPPQFAPALVLIGFRRIGILLAFEPEAEPVHIALLRNPAIPRLLQDVRVPSGARDRSR